MLDPLRSRYALFVVRVPLSLERGDERSFVFRYVADDGAVGVFVPMEEAPSVGTSVLVQAGVLELAGVVGWRNGASSDTPGAGVVLTLEDEADASVDELIGFVRAIAYLPREEGS